MHCLSRYEELELESSENTQIKSQNDRPSPEISHESRANLQVPARICDVEGGAVCSKNSTFGYFDETAWTPRLRSPGYTLEVMLQGTISNVGTILQPFEIMEQQRCNAMLR